MARTASKKAEAATSRREEILAVAAQVIAERGIKGATVRDIGEAAGILSGSLYYHFDSKEQIILELLMPSVVEQYEESRAVRDAGSSPTEVLSALIRSSVAATASNPQCAVILRNDGRAFRDIEALAPVAEVRDKSRALYIEVLNAGIKAGEFRSDLEVEVVVHGLIDAMLGAARWFTGPKKRNPDRVAEALVDLFVRGIAV